jgi:transposase
MEATGVYHESLAYFLYDQECSLTIVLPSKISNYARTLDVKTVTDKTASEAITRFGLERKLDDWKRPSPVLKKLRQLTRERDQLVQQRTIAKNQLHAENAEAEPNQSTIKRTTALINMMNKQEKEIRAEITLLIKSNEELKSWITRLCTIPGIGQLTAATILAETNGFELIRNKKQLVSYAGLDVREKQSGTSVKGKARISKKGNKFLRKAMHLPALTAIRHDERFKAIFARSVAKHGIKMKAVVPIQRKLLEMAYILFKNETVYDKEYLQREVEKELLVLKN